MRISPAQVPTTVMNGNSTASSRSETPGCEVVVVVVSGGVVVVVVVAVLVPVGVTGSITVTITVSLAKEPPMLYTMSVYS